MPGETVKSRGQVDQQVDIAVLLCLDREVRQLGFFLERLPESARIETPQRFGNRVDALGCDPERKPGVASRAARTIGGVHRKQCGALAAVALKNHAIHIVAAGRFNVDINIGQS